MSELPIFDCRESLTIYRIAQWVRGKALACENKGLGFEAISRETIFFSISDIGMDSDVDIGTLPISEGQLSVRHIFLRYWNNRCRFRMLDIADIKIDFDVHLC